MQFQAISDFFTVLDTTTVNAQGNFRQRAVNWNVPLVFKQATILVTGFSGDCTRIGNLYLEYDIKGYVIEEAAD